MAKSRLWILGMCLLAAGFGTAQARAQETETETTTTTTTTEVDDDDDDDIWHFKVYGGPAYVAPMSDSPVTFDTVTDTIEAEDHVGWNLGLEGRFNKLIGLELDYVNANQDVVFGGQVIGETTFSPLTLTLNLHLIHTKVIDFYIGPSYSYVNWGDIELNANGVDLVGSGANVGTDSEHGWGASVGLDIGFGKHFAIMGGLKWLAVDLPTTSGAETSVKPLVARLGAAFRF